MNAELDAFAAGVASRQVEAPPDLASLTASLVDSPPLAKAVLDSAGARSACSVVPFCTLRDLPPAPAPLSLSSPLFSFPTPPLYLLVHPLLHHLSALLFRLGEYRM